jgi:cytochrome oxidase assembly protein ShyY1
VLRTACRPRWLALLVVVLAAATGMSLLGQWQLDRARERGRIAEAEREARVARPVPLAGVLTARQPFPTKALGRRVVAHGTWDPGAQLLVANRTLDGRSGLWVLTPLRLADGSAVPVVRGWVSGPSDPAAVPPAAGAPAAVTGVLQPSEPPLDLAPGQSSGLPAGQVARVDVTDLVNRWPYRLTTGYLVLQSEQPAPSGPAPAPVTVQPPKTGLALRNLSYALQWWLFAGFGLFLWWRLVRDDHLERTRPAAASTQDRPAETINESIDIP